MLRLEQRDGWVREAYGITAWFIPWVIWSRRQATGRIDHRKAQDIMEIYDVNWLEINIAKGMDALAVQS